MSQQQQKAIVYASAERSFYVGKLERHFRRLNVPSTLIVSLEDELELLNPLRCEKIRSRSFLIPAGMNLEVDTHGASVALCFLDDLGTDLARLKPRMSDSVKIGSSGCYTGIRGQEDVIEFANLLRNERPGLQAAVDIVDEWLGHPARAVPDPDPRIMQAVELIKSTADRNIAVEEIAQRVGLSVPRLIQLFKKVTGSPIRRFRLWQRIFLVASRLADGLSLNDAAIAAGFADYAQFSRTYRELAGAKASDARKHTELRIQLTPVI